MTNHPLLAAAVRAAIPCGRDIMNSTGRTICKCGEYLESRGLFHPVPQFCKWCTESLLATYAAEQLAGQGASENFGCGKQCIERDEDGCVLWTFECGKIKSPEDMPTTCHYCGECTGKLASLGLKAAAFRREFESERVKGWNANVRVLAGQFGLLDI